MPDTTKLTAIQQTAINAISKHGGIELDKRGALFFRVEGGISHDNVPRRNTVNALFVKDLIRFVNGGSKLEITDAGKALVS